jgi:hypothetical protein
MFTQYQKMKSILFSAALFFAAQYTQAQDWTGAINSDWNNPQNWNGVPQNGDDITISTANYSGAMAHPVINTNSNFSPAGMLVDGGSVLTINANLTTTDRVEILGAGTQVILNAGILTISGGSGNARFIFAEEAHFEMNGGELNVGQRLLFELGASGVLNDGTINISETFALIDGTGTVSSSFIQNGGFIQTEEFGFENEAGNFHPLYRLMGGVFNVTAIFLCEGAAPGSGLGEFHATNGTANFSGTFGNIAGSTMNYVLRITESGVVNTNCSVIDQLAGDSIVISNGGSMNITANVVWNNNGVVTGESGELVINANTILNGNGEYQFPNLTVLPNKSLIQNAAQLIAVNGDFVLAGTYNQMNHVLEFNGSAEQDFTLSPDQTLDALIMNNSGDGVSVSGSLTITDSLKWIDGILNMNANELIFTDGALSLLASEDSYAIGTVIKKGNEAFLFPVGSAGLRYRPVEISAPAEAATEITVNYYPESYTVQTPVNAPLQTISTLEYWNVERAGSTDFVTVSLGWNNAGASGLIDCPSVSLAYWDNSAWNMIASTVSGFCTGNGAGIVSSSSEIEEFGIYTIGFTEGVYQQAITVCSGESYSVGTSTYDSTGVYFDMFTDVNGEDSLVVTALTVLPQPDLTVQENLGYLTSNALDVNYQWVDCGNNFEPVLGATNQTFAPAQNGTYAVIIETNGCSDTSSCVVVDNLSLSENPVSVSVYPNPVQSGKKLFVKCEKELISYSWISAGGTHVKTADIINSDVHELNVPELLGVYILTLSFADGSTSYSRVSVSN